jgi:hypothetical protein
LFQMKSSRRLKQYLVENATLADTCAKKMIVPSICYSNMMCDRDKSHSYEDEWTIMT